MWIAALRDQVQVMVKEVKDLDLLVKSLLRDQVQVMVKEVKDLDLLVKSFDRRIQALEQVAFGDGKPKKKVAK